MITITVCMSITAMLTIMVLTITAMTILMGILTAMSMPMGTTMRVAITMKPMRMEPIHMTTATTGPTTPMAMGRRRPMPPVWRP